MKRERYVWWVEIPWQVGSKCAYKIHGAQYVMTFGTLRMLGLSADNLDCPQKVSKDWRRCSSTSQAEFSSHPIQCQLLCIEPHLDKEKDQYGWMMYSVKAMKLHCEHVLVVLLDNITVFILKMLVLYVLKVTHAVLAIMYCTLFTETLHKSQNIRKKHFFTAVYHAWHL